LTKVKTSPVFDPVRFKQSVFVRKRPTADVVVADTPISKGFEPLTFKFKGIRWTNVLLRNNFNRNLKMYLDVTCRTLM